MSTKKAAGNQPSVGAIADKIIDDQLETIDNALDKINTHLKKYESLIEKRDRLQAARRALLGGNKLTGAGGNRVRREDVVDYVKTNPGEGPTKIAESLGVAYTTVASHLYRGKLEGVFLSRDKRWWVRDPENGLNTEEDLADAA